MIVVHIPYDGTTTQYTRYCYNAMFQNASGQEEMRMELHACPPWPKMAADNHSAAVGAAFKATEKSPDDLHIICDSDTVVVHADWDLVIRHLFDNQSFDCVGTAYQRIGTPQTGHGMKQTYKGRPNVEWLALKPGKQWHLFEPAKTGKADPVLMDTPEAQQIFGLPWGYELLTDACWNFPQFLHEHQLSSVAMENIGDYRDFVALKGLGYYEEWHLAGVPFVVHQGKSRKMPFRSVPYSTDFYNRCDMLVRQIR